MSLFSVLSSAFIAARAVSAGRAESKALSINARESLRRAGEERRVTEDEAQDVERRLSAIAAANRAARAGSGVTRAGSPKLTERAFASEVALQISKIRRGGESSAAAFEQQARQQRSLAAASKRAGLFRAGTTLLTAGEEVFG